MRLMNSLFLLALLACGATALFAQQTTGTLTAQGDGSPRLYMATGTVQIAGSGALLVSHNVTINLNGQTLTATKGALAGVPMDTYNGFNGSATISGTNFSVGMYGTGITLTVSGNGFAILFGTGAYTLTGADGKAVNGKWTLAPWMKGGDPHLDPKTIAISIGQLNDVVATGSLSAQGDGSPRLYMTSGTVQIAGNGTLMVSHNAKVTFAGQTLTAKPGKLAGQDTDAYDGFNSSATITGDHFVVGMYGKGITTGATGAGYAILFGTGTYAITGADGKNTNGNWTLASFMPGGNPHLDPNTIKIPIGQVNDIYNPNNYK